MKKITARQWKTATHCDGTITPLLADHSSCAKKLSSIDLLTGPGIFYVLTSNRLSTLAVRGVGRESDYTLAFPSPDAVNEGAVWKGTPLTSM